MKRLNVKLTLWLIVLTVFSVVGAYFLHEYQIDRNADLLRILAEQASARGDAKEAVKQYNQYLKHRDDPDGYSALAALVVDIAKDVGATRQDKMRAYTILEEAIRRHPDLDEVRERLVEYTMEMGRFEEALDHIQKLLQKNPGNTERQFKVAVCYYAMSEPERAIAKLNELVGYDAKTEQFAPEPPAGAKEIGAFELLAQLLRRKPDGEQQAGIVMQQCVTWNPDSAKAHLRRTNYLVSTATDIKSPQFAEAKTELARAYELDSQDVDVLLGVAVYAISEADYDKAQELLDQALKLQPERQEIYLRLSQLNDRQGNLKGAAEQLTLGLKQATDTNGILERLFELQLQLNEIEDARETCNLMHEKGVFVPELLRYEEACLKFAEGNFLDATREFEAIRPAMARFNGGKFAQQADMLLGKSYQVLGQSDRQLEAYRRVLQVYPTHLGARIGEAIALHALGRQEEAATTTRQLLANAENLPTIRGDLLQLLIGEELRKPQPEREWKHVEKVANLLSQVESRSELDNTMLKADLLLLEDRVTEAGKLMTAARKENPKDVRTWTALAKLLLRDSKADKVPRLLELAQEELGDVPALRTERIRYILHQGGDQAAAELLKLESGADKLSEEDHTSLMMQLGTAYTQAHDFEDAKRCWKYCIEQDPKNPTLHQYLFELAVDFRDKAGMRAAVKELHDQRYFGAQTPLYKYCAATEIVTLLGIRRQGKPGPLTDEDRDMLAEARKLIDEALIARGEWYVLWRVKGEIEQNEGNFDAAISSYQRSLECNRTGQAVTARRLLTLLHNRNRFSEANEVLNKYIGQTDASDPQQKLFEDIRSRGGDQATAVAMAEKDIERDPKNVLHYLWLAQLLERNGRTEESEKAARKAVEVAPDRTEGWELLVMLLQGHKKKAEAVQAAHDAAKALPENSPVTARLYERVEDLTEAEKLYKAGLEQKPDDISALRRLAEFYYSNGGQMDKAMPLLDQIIEKTAKSTDKMELAQLDWARRAKAQRLAATRDYASVMTAVRLIEQNAKGGKLGEADLTALFMLLSDRPEPESRIKSMQLLEQLRALRPLNSREQVAMAQLYERKGDWAQARELMSTAVSISSDDLDVLLVFAQMLSNHEEYDDATRWAEALDELINKGTIPVSEVVRKQTLALRARLLAKKGESAKAAELLSGALPRPLPQGQLYLLDQAARLMEEFGLNDAAEKLLAEYMSQDPRGAVAMASFLGRRGELDKAFALLDQSRKTQPMREVLSTALEAIRKNPAEGTKERMQTLEDWTNESLKTETNQLPLRLLLAEMFDLQGRYAESMKVYRDVLADPKSNDLQKAIVKNNLAFVLAIQKNRASSQEALTMIQEAIKVLGPTSDLLDTRGLIYLAQGNMKQALADLRLASSDYPTASKYFHLAQAEQRANNLEAARGAMAKTEQLGLNVKSFTPIEQATYAQLTQELK